MESNEERKKKLEAGKEKLAAFRKKKAKCSKNTNERTQRTHKIPSQQNGEQFSSSEVLQSSNEPTHLVDSDQFSVTSGDECSDEESDSRYKLVNVHQGISALEEKVEGNQLALDTPIAETLLTHEMSELSRGSMNLDKVVCDDIKVTDIESALAQRDSLITHLTKSLQSAFKGDSASEELIDQVQSLGQHVSTLQAQLQQANKSLEEQVFFREVSTLAVQAAKTQMLQLQAIINQKDVELASVLQELHSTNKSVGNYASRDFGKGGGDSLSARDNDTDIRTMQKMYEEKVKECEDLKYVQQLLMLKEEELVGSLDLKSKEIHTHLDREETWKQQDKELRSRCEFLQKQLSDRGEESADKANRLRLENELADLRQAHENDVREITMFKARNQELEECHSCYETLEAKYLECLTHIQQLKTENMQLQNSVDTVQSLKEESYLLRADFKSLNTEHQGEVEKRLHAEKMYSELESSFSADTERLKNKVNEHQDRICELQAQLQSSQEDLNVEKDNVARIHAEQEHRDQELNVKDMIISDLKSSFAQLEFLLAGKGPELCSCIGSVDTVSINVNDGASVNYSLSESQGVIDRVIDLQTRLANLESQNKQLSEEFVQLQSESFLDKHVFGVEISEKNYHLEQLEDQMEVIHAENKELRERLNDLDCEASEKCKNCVDILRTKEYFESQLQTMTIERDTLLQTVDSLTSQVKDLKVELSGQKGVKIDQGGISNHPEDGAVDREKTLRTETCILAAEVELLRNDAAVMLTTLHHEIGVAERLKAELLKKTENMTLNSESLTQNQVAQPNLNTGHVCEKEQTKTSQCELSVQVEQVIDSSVPVEGGEERFAKSTPCNMFMRDSLIQSDKSEVDSLKIELSDLRAAMDIMREKESAQVRNMEEMQSQLEVTISQWRKLQVIVQEKELEVQNVQEEFQEQKRIVSTQKRNHEENMHVLCVELESLKEKWNSDQDLIRNLQNENRTLEQDLELKNREVSAALKGMSDSTSVFDNLKLSSEEMEVELANRKSRLEESEEELRDLKQCLALKEVEVTELNKSVKEKDLLTIQLKDKISEKEENVSDLEKKVNEMENSIEDSKIDASSYKVELDSLCNTLKDRETHITLLTENVTEKNIKVTELTNCLAERDVQVAELTNTVAETNIEVTEFKNDLAKSNVLVSELTNSLEERDNQVTELTNSLSEKNVQVTELTNNLEERAIQVSELTNSVEERDVQVTELTNDLSEKNVQVAELTNNLSERDDQVTELTNKVAERDFQVTGLTNNLLERDAHVTELTNRVAERDVQVTELTNRVAEKDVQVTELTNSVAEKDVEVTELTNRVAERDVQVTELTIRVAEKDVQVTELTNRVAEKDVQVTELTNNVAERDVQVTELTNNLSERDVHVSELTKCVSEKDVHIADLQGGLTVMSDKDSLISELRSSLAEKEMQIVELGNCLKENESALFESSQSHAEKAKQISDTNGILTEKEAQIRDLSNSLAEKESTLVELDARFSDEINNLKANVTSKESEIIFLRKTVNNTEAENIDLKYRLSDVESELNSQTQMNVDHSEIVLKLKQDLISAEREVNDKKTEAADVRTELDKEYRENEKLSKLYECSKTELSACASQRVELEEQVSRMAVDIENISSNAKLAKGDYEDRESELLHQFKCLEVQIEELEDKVMAKESQLAEISQSMSDEQSKCHEINARFQKMERMMHSQEGVTSFLFEELSGRDALVVEQKLQLDLQEETIMELSVAAENNSASVSQLEVSNSTLKETVSSLTSETQTVLDEKIEFELRVSKLTNDLKVQETRATQFVVENKQLQEKVMLLSEQLEDRDATIFDLKHDGDMYTKENSDLKKELEVKDTDNAKLELEIQTLGASLKNVQEERELLKANFDSCMEDMQQRFMEQDMEMKHLKSQVTEETRNVQEVQDQMKEMYEQQLLQVEEKFITSEKTCDRLDKELMEIKVRLASEKDMHEQELSEQELSFQSTNSELVKIKDHLSKITANHECEVAELKRLQEIQTTELEENCLSLEKAVAEYKRQLNELTAKWSREKVDMEQACEMQLSDAEEKRRFAEIEICRLKKHLEEMRLDHEKDMNSLEKSYEARLFELEDTCSVTAAELDRVRKSLLSVEGDFSGERQSIEIRIEELESIRRDLQQKISSLEDEIMILRDEAARREDEMKAVLQQAAEREQEKTHDMMSEINSLKHLTGTLNSQLEDKTSSLRKQYEEQVSDLQSRNNQLEEKVRSLELYAEQDLELRNSQAKIAVEEKAVGVETLQGQINTLGEENSLLKGLLLKQKNATIKLRMKSGVEDICPPFIPDFPSEIEVTDGVSSSSEVTDAYFSPVTEQTTVLEGFVAEQFDDPLPISRPSALMHEIAEEPDFVEEKDDVFEPEIINERLISGADYESGQLDIHPIRDEEICEGFRPESPSHFIMETLEDPSTPVNWSQKHGQSPSYKQTAQFDFSSPVQTEQNESSDQNSNCRPNNSQWVSSTSQDPPLEVLYEKRLKDVREELEEQYVAELRKQEVNLGYEFDKKQENYKQEMEHHFAQKMKAVGYEWERKFTTALQKVRKDLEKRHQKELKQLRQGRYSKNPSGEHLPLQQSSVTGSDQDWKSDMNDTEGHIADPAEGSGALGEVVEQLHRENQELAEVRDVLLEQIELSNTRGLHSKLQQELQTMLTGRESQSPQSSTTPTPTLTSASPTHEISQDVKFVQYQLSGAAPEAVGMCHSESCEARERFLEELEEISQQSSQDLPLEWELTTAVTAPSGDFELEPELRSVWEVFDGRCLRQDCLEVRHRYHKLCQWVDKSKGDGVDEGSYQFKEVPGDNNVLLDESGGSLKITSTNASSKLDSFDSFDHDSSSIDNSSDLSDSAAFSKIMSLDMAEYNVGQKGTDLFYSEGDKIQLRCETLHAPLLTKESDEKQQNASEISFHSRVDTLHSLASDTHQALKSSSCVSGYDNRELFGKDTSSQTDNNSLDQSHFNSVSLLEMQNLHLMLMEKEETIKNLHVENSLLKSKITLDNDSVMTVQNQNLKIEGLQEQVESQQKLLEHKEKLLMNLKSDLNRLIYPASFEGTDQSRLRRVNDESKNSIATMKEEVNKEMDRVLEHMGVSTNSLDTIIDEGNEKFNNHELKSESACPINVYSPLTVDVDTVREGSSSASSGNSILLQSSLEETGYNQQSEVPSLDLCNGELAEEISRLRKDVKDTKDMYSKENSLLQEALLRDREVKSRIMSQTDSDSSSLLFKSRPHAARSLGTTVMSEPSSTCSEEAEILRQRLAVCMEQNKMLEEENTTLRARLREQDAVIILLKERLKEKEHDANQWQMSFGNQLAALQKQRNDLLQLIQEKESNKSTMLSESVSGTLREAKLRDVQEDLMGKMEELDHLHKMLTQRQVELQHCEAERRHLEQLCLLKEMTEIQLMKQKRLMEEQVSEIELRLRERETTLVEEKSKLLRELRVKDQCLSQVSRSSSGETVVDSSGPMPRSASLRDISSMISGLGTPDRRHSMSQGSKIGSNNAELADKQHLDAIEKLRKKLKLEYDIRTARIEESQASAIASYWYRHSKQT